MPSAQAAMVLRVRSSVMALRLGALAAGVLAAGERAAGVVVGVVVVFGNAPCVRARRI